MNTTINIAMGITTLIITAAVYSLVLQLATKWQSDYTPRYWNAYKACFIVLAIIALLSMALTAAIPNATPWLIAVCIGFMIQVAVYSNVLEGPAGDISYGKAAAISFNQFILVMVLVGLIALIKSML